MINDLIRRFVLLDIFDSFRDKEKGNSVNIGLEHVIAIVEAVNTVDAEPVRHGRWVQSTKEGEDWGGFFYRYTCTVCGWHCGSNPNGLYVFCPGCGAKMDLEAQNE